MKFIDTHTHLYLEQFEKDLPQVMARAQEVLDAVYLPNIDTETVEGMNQLSKDYPAFCFPMIGLHPCSVKDNFKEELAKLKMHLDSEPYVAVGEIGSDLYWDKTFEKEQEEAFRIQIDWALKKGLPIVIHSRETIDKNIDIVRSMQDGNLKGIFHCFGGSKEQAKQIIDLGFSMGLGGVLTFKNSKLRETIRDFSIDHFVLETDAPYLTPHPHRGTRNESAYIPLVAKVLAETLDLDIEEVAHKTSDNARRIYHPEAI